jgi:hypothetical protein
MAGTIEIIVDMYSGRHNPKMDLSADEIEELRRRLDKSRQQPLGERPEPPQLGYRGFVILNEALEAGLPYSLHIYGSVVTETEQRPEPALQKLPHPRFFRDAGRIENWLLERAAVRGLADNIAAMGGPRHH